MSRSACKGRGARTRVSPDSPDPLVSVDQVGTVFRRGYEDDGGTVPCARPRAAGCSDSSSPSLPSRVRRRRRPATVGEVARDRRGSGHRRAFGTDDGTRAGRPGAWRYRHRLVDIVARPPPVRGATGTGAAPERGAGPRASRRSRSRRSTCPEGRRSSGGGPPLGRGNARPEVRTAGETKCTASLSTRPGGIVTCGSSPRLGGPKCTAPPTSTSWRSTRMVRRRRSTRSSARPASSPSEGPM
jgi:hypothetical protein